MGAAFTCGLEKVIVPFFDQGIPVEYELVRSITTVAQSKRKRLGVVNTDAQLFGGFDFQRMSQTPETADRGRAGEAVRGRADRSQQSD